MENYERLYQCTKCLIVDAAILPCDHTYCKKCLMESVIDYSLTNKTDNFICPECKNPIFLEFIRRFYMPDEEAIDFFENLGRCIKCKQESKKIIKLICKHLVCEVCLAFQIDSKIKEKASFLSITCWKCQVFIPPIYYNKIISNELNENLKKPVGNYPICKCHECGKEKKSNKDNFSCCKACYSCGLGECKCLNPPIKQYKLADKRKNNPNPIDQFQQLKNQLCKACKEVPGTLLPCSHYICADCLKLDIIKQMKLNPFEPSRTCSCGQIIPLNYIVESFGSKAAYDRALVSIGEDWAFSPKFECEICLGIVEVEGSITLECDHRFCHPCMQNYFTELITTSNVSETQLICPKCSTAVSHNTVQGVVSKELYKKYIDFSFRNWRPDEGFILKYCAFCDGAAEIDAGAKRFKCPKCNKAYCPQCNNDHRESINCEEWRELLENGNKGNEEEKQNHVKKKKEEKIIVKKGVYGQEKDKREQLVNLNPPKNARPATVGYGNRKNLKDNPPPEVEKNKKPAPQMKAKAIAEENQKKDMEYIKNNCKQCPKCKVSAEKESGCNFMKCRWPTCHDTYFCFICGVILTRNHHYSHYKISGPFGKTCNKIDGIKDI